MKKLLFIAFLLMAGCVHQSAPAVDTSKVSSSLGQISSNLSAIDGKSVVIEKWLKSTK